MGMWFLLLVVLLLLLWAGRYAVEETSPPALPSPAGIEPAAVSIPRGQHAPDPERARRALEESLLLLEAARGSFTSPHTYAGSDQIQVDVNHLIDAVQHARDGLALVREAAERDEGVQQALSREGVDPWTEPVCLEAVLHRGSPEVWREAEGFARGTVEAARRALDELTARS